MKVRGKGKTKTKETTTRKKPAKASRSNSLNQYFRSTKSGANASAASRRDSKPPGSESRFSPLKQLPFQQSRQKAESSAGAEYTAEAERSDLEELRSFDLCSEFGPCIGMTRVERWQRAERFGLSPPDRVLQIVREHSNDSRYTHWCDCRIMALINLIHFVHFHYIFDTLYSFAAFCLQHLARLPAMKSD